MSVCAKGLVALVTGAASGLGKATAQMFLNQGCRVIALDQNKFHVQEDVTENAQKPEEHKKFLEEVSLQHEDFDESFDNAFFSPERTSSGLSTNMAQKQARPSVAHTEPLQQTFFKNQSDDNCIFATADIQSPDEVAMAIEEAKSQWGRLDVTVNCAGIARVVLCYNPTQDRVVDLEEFKTVLDVNVTGTFNVIRLSAKAMAKNEINENRERGVIINTSTFAAFEGPRSNSSTGAAGGAVVGMTLPISRDLAPLGIRVNTIAPGFIDTPALGKPSAEILQVVGLLNAFPNRVGWPEEFAHLVNTIVNNPMLNGETIRLDAGMRAPPC